jgi:hypothetical protein
MQIIFLPVTCDKWDESVIGEKTVMEEYSYLFLLLINMPTKENSIFPREINLNENKEHQVIIN